MTVLTERKRSYDFLKEYLDSQPNYNFEAATIKNVSGAAISAGALYPGLPLLYNTDHWETVAAGSVSGADGFFCDDKCSEALANNATSTKKYKILKRGPATVNLDAVGNDLDADAAYNKTTVLGVLEAMSPPVLQYRDPATTETQTT